MSNRCDPLIFSLAETAVSLQAGRTASGCTSRSRLICWLMGTMKCEFSHARLVLHYSNLADDLVNNKLQIESMQLAKTAGATTTRASNALTCADGRHRANLELICFSQSLVHDCRRLESRRLAPPWTVQTHLVRHRSTNNTLHDVTV